MVFVCLFVLASGELGKKNSEACGWLDSLGFTCRLRVLGSGKREWDILAWYTLMRQKRETPASSLLQQPLSFLEASALAIPLKPSIPLSQLHPYPSVCLMLIQPLGLSINATFSDKSFLASKIRMLLWNTEIFHFCI